MEARHNEEYHFFIDELADRGFYGSVTLFFQGGIVERNQVVETNTKTEVREKMEKQKKQKPRRVLTAVTHPKNGGAA